LPCHFRKIFGFLLRIESQIKNLKPRPSDQTAYASDGVRFEADLTLREIDGSGAQTWIGFTQEYSAAEVVSVMFNRS
jgi:hypothetical protein